VVLPYLSNPIVDGVICFIVAYPRSVSLTL
jgi:hypothetical protein